MKKRILTMLGFILVTTVIVGCSSNLPKDGGAAQEPVQEESVNKETPEATEEQPAEEKTEVAAGGLKTGMAVITSLEKSADAGEEDGLVQAESNVAAVVIDADGKIVNCVIDAAQTKINFTKEGKITSELKGDLKSKKDLGAEYGMGKASSIGKEWNEQAEAFAAYAVGKTVEELKGIAVTETGAPADADLSASVTVSVGGFIAVVEKAAKNAAEIGTQAGDKLGLAVISDITKSKDASAEDGVGQVDTTYVLTTASADGVITGCLLDASQSTVMFDATGKLTGDLKAEVKTKNELGAEYGMKKASSIGKEWNEQADAFAKYVTGKTVEEVKGIAVKEGVPADEDLAASVTIHIGSYQNLVEKAVSTAK